MPKTFTLRDLQHFSAFTNVQALTLQNVNISRFVPGIKRYFGHFSPTLRSIVLVRPRCTPRQLAYFLSLFSKLDLYLYPFPPPFPPLQSNQPAFDSELVPFSSPKLRGRLKLVEFTWVETLTDLIASCGGLWFRYIDLRNVASCAPILLGGVCRDTRDTAILCER